MTMNNDHADTSADTTATPATPTPCEATPVATAEAGIELLGIDERINLLGNALDRHDPLSIEYYALKISRNKLVALRQDAAKLGCKLVPR